MPIKSNLSRILGERRIKITQLAEMAGVANNTVLALYHERAKGITFEVLEKICLALDCEPGDILSLVRKKTNDS
jgi:putative transcriptional regulator